MIVTRNLGNPRTQNCHYDFQYTSDIPGPSRQASCVSTHVCGRRELPTLQKPLYLQALPRRVLVL